MSNKIVDSITFLSRMNRCMESALVSKLENGEGIVIELPTHPDVLDHGGTFLLIRNGDVINIKMVTEDDEEAVKNLRHGETVYV